MLSITVRSTPGHRHEHAEAVHGQHREREQHPLAQLGELKNVDDDTHRRIQLAWLRGRI
jgi:hypothetical protein